MRDKVISVGDRLVGAAVSCLPFCEEGLNDRGTPRRPPSDGACACAVESRSN